MHGTPGEDTAPTNTEAGAIVGRVPSRGTLSRIQAPYEISGLAPRGARESSPGMAKAQAPRPVSSSMVQIDRQGRGQFRHFFV